MILECIFAVVLGIFAYLYINRRPKNFPPGPLSVPILGYFPFLGTLPHKTFNKLSKKYGDIFTVYFGSYPVVVLNEFDVIKEAFRGEDFLGRPKNMASMARLGGESELNTGLGFSEGEVWKKQRRFTAKGLRDSCHGIKEEIKDSISGEVYQENRLESLIHAEILCLKKDLKKSSGEILFSKTFEPYLMRIMWQLVSNNAANKHIGVCDSDAQSVLDKFCRGMFEAPMLMVLHFFPWASKVASLIGQDKFKSILQPPVELMKKIIGEHEESYDEKLTDFVYSYLNEIHEAEDTKSSFYKGTGMKNLKYTLVDLFLAGFETTGTSLEWIFLILLKHPDVLVKVKNEINSVIGKNRQPRFSDKSKMPYTEAAISEALRIASMSPTGMMRKTLQDTTIRGYFIPKGTLVLPNFYNVHHDGKYWGENVKKVLPERFLNKDGSYLKNERLIPFGIGKRNCPGENIANTEIFLFLTSLLQTFDFKLAESSKNATLEPHVGLVLSPQPYKILVKDK